MWGRIISEIIKSIFSLRYIVIFYPSSSILFPRYHFGCIDDQASWLSAARMLRDSLRSQGVFVEDSDDTLNNTDTNTITPQKSSTTAGDDDFSTLTPSNELRNRMLEDLVMSYRGILSTMVLSARAPEHGDGLLGELNLLWDKTTELILYPLHPIFDTVTTEFLPFASAAITRIFQIIDTDGDNYISIDEFSEYQSYVYGIRLSDNEIQNYFLRLAEDFPEGIGSLNDPVADNTGNEIYDIGSIASMGMTEAGFKRMLTEHIFHMSPDAVWQVFHAYGYRWGVPSPLSSASSSSSKSGTVTTGSANNNNTKRLYLYIPDKYTLIRPSYPDSYYQLSGISSINDYSLLTIDDLSKRTLQSTGLGFIGKLFTKYLRIANTSIAMTTDNYPAKYTLGKDDIERMFAVCPDIHNGQHPFSSIFPYNTTHNNSNEISLTTWIHLWQTLLICEPRQALLSLYALGFVTRRRGTTNTSSSSSSRTSIVTPSLVNDIQFDFNPHYAIEEAPARKIGNNVPCSVRRIFVIGSQGSGKSSLIYHYLNGPNALRECILKASSPNELFSNQEKPIHYAGTIPFNRQTLLTNQKNTPKQQNGNNGTTNVIDDVDALPMTLAITEWPSSLAFEAMELASDQADSIIITVDPTSLTSINYFRKVVELVPDGVPTVVVATQHENRKTVAGAGYTYLKSLCSKEETLLQRQELEDNFISSVRTLGPNQCITGEDILQNEEIKLSECGLDLEIFEFGSKAKSIKTEELFKYITLRSLTPGKDNPLTQIRRSHYRRQLWYRRILLGLGVITTVTVIGGITAYTMDYKGTKQYVNTKIEKFPWFGKSSKK